MILLVRVAEKLRAEEPSEAELTMKPDGVVLFPDPSSILFRILAQTLEGQLADV